ncbi:LysR family transcriptional regulator [Parasedimentitalea maritima]|uniref:LysR family transcriptional regulator n=1 Tax=Parasedimentitalea maritima TaxID=2578117 RepID=A0A6A4RJC0_9RHOB|nr:LysR family transcriptional regulator [Zongyanglinia marina]KAE9631606.1 LysR family transcriptional regulator [Zongyanglinia marina]
MEWKSVSFDWNQIRAFLATVDEGSFSAAARVLGLTQPTLGRQIAALEADLGVTLFERNGRRMDLTKSGLELVEQARAMLQAAGQISLTASGQSQSVEGEVSITATEAMMAYMLPPFVARLRQHAPGIEIRLLGSDKVSDLTAREADIAIRHVQPEQPDLIAKKLGQTQARIYGATSYLDRIGRPDATQDLAGVDFIGQDHYLRSLRVLSGRGLQLDRANYKMISSSSVTLWEMVKSGLGLAVMTDDVAQRTLGVEPAFPDMEPFDVPVWLVSHRELHSSRRIRMVFDLLAEHFSENRTYR